MYIPKPETPVAFKNTHGLSSSAGDVTGDVGNGISWEFTAWWLTYSEKYDLIYQRVRYLSYL